MEGEVVGDAEVSIARAVPRHPKQSVNRDERAFSVVDKSFTTEPRQRAVAGQPTGRERRVAARVVPIVPGQQPGDLHVPWSIRKVPTITLLTVNQPHSRDLS